MRTNDNPERFDLQSALKRFAQDHELLDEAIAIFKEEAPRHIALIKDHLDQGNLKDASISSHTLKSECGAVGAVKAHHLSLIMEKSTASNDQSKALDLLPDLEAEIELAVKLLPNKTAGL